MTKQRITRQERIISELKTFQVTALEEIFKKVENLDPYVIEEIVSKLPTEIQFSLEARENPFNLYCGYLDYHREVECNPTALEKEAQAYKNKMQMMQLEMKNLKSQFDAA
jgi:hypothetical protein